MDCNGLASSLKQERQLIVIIERDQHRHCDRRASSLTVADWVIDSGMEAAPERKMLVELFELDRRRTGEPLMIPEELPSKLVARIKRTKVGTKFAFKRLSVGDSRI
jgi:hypothetical protein